MSKKDNTAKIFQTILIVGGIIGGIIGIGDRLYAKKTDMAVVKVTITNIEDKVEKIWSVFDEHNKIKARRAEGK